MKLVCGAKLSRESESTGRHFPIYLSVASAAKIDEYRFFNEKRKTKVNPQYKRSPLPLKRNSFHKTILNSWHTPSIKIQSRETESLSENVILLMFSKIPKVSGQLAVYAEKLKNLIDA